LRQMGIEGGQQTLQISLGLMQNSHDREAGDAHADAPIGRGCS
jgi:hypothetical protein